MRITSKFGKFLILASAFNILNSCQTGALLRARLPQSDAQVASMAIIGDAGLAGNDLDQLQRSIETEKISSLILPGDNLYFGSYNWTWYNWKRSGFKFDVVAIGNHNKGYDSEVKYFEMPGQFYTVVKNGARFIVMNSDNQATLDIQFDWLYEEIQKATEDLIFLVYHHPSFNSGSDDNWKQREQFQLRMREFLKSESAKKITALLLGHAHITSFFNYGDIPAIIAGSGREALKAKAVSYTTEDNTAVKTLYLAPRTQHWVALKINDGAKNARLEVIRVTDNAVVCSASLQTGNLALDSNCALAF